MIHTHYNNNNKFLACKEKNDDITVFSRTDKMGWNMFIIINIRIIMWDHHISNKMYTFLSECHNNIFDITMYVFGHI